MCSISESTINRLIQLANVNLKGNESAEEKMTILKESGLLLNNVKRLDQSVKPLKLGLLHSTSGATASSEIPVKRATELAIEELHKAGFPIVYATFDYESEPRLAAKYAEELCDFYNVDAIFGCWTSASRKAVLPVLQKYNIPLFYPVQYEGCESSPYVYYHGATANQQIIPAVSWVNNSERKNVFLVGSDYVFPRTANKIIKNYTEFLGGRVLAERYVPLTYNGDFSEIMNEIVRLQPTCIHNTLNGSANKNFFQALQNVRNKLASNFTVMSYSIAENDIRNIGPELCAGYNTAWNYYMSQEGVSNQIFVNNMRATYGNDTITDAPSYSGYTSVYAFFKLLFLNHFRTSLDDLRTRTTTALWFTPTGDQDYNINQHVYMDCIIGQILPSGQIQTVLRFENIEPEPCLRTYPWASNICPNACN